MKELAARQGRTLARLCIDFIALGGRVAVLIEELNESRRTSVSEAGIHDVADRRSPPYREQPPVAGSPVAATFAICQVSGTVGAIHSWVYGYRYW